MKETYIDTLVTEFHNCFGSVKRMQPLLGIILNTLKSKLNVQLRLRDIFGELGE